MTVTLKVKKLVPEAKLPEYATPGAAAFDIKATSSHLLLPSFQEKVHTGLAFEVPEGHVLLIFSRSGHGFKNEIRLSNCVGVIDSDYRGELMVALKDDRNLPAHADDRYDIQPGDRIAQGIVVPIPQVQLVEVGDLSNTARGTGGLGSTGK
jgi:dUTP pyrophosphatase